jgi:hypothetical protein
VSATLGTWQRCPLCNEYGYSGAHRCRPEWEACDGGDRIDQREWERVRAADAESAAERYCAQHDPFNEYGTVSASRTVLVRPLGRNDLRRQYTVTGELQPVYTAISQQLDGDD